MRWWIVVLFLIYLSAASATTFLPQTLDDLDRQADYIIVGTVTNQNGLQENKTISTQTAIAVEEWVRGSSIGDTVVVKELGGIIGDVMMVVPGSPHFEQRERVVLFMKEDSPARWRHRIAYGHTVGMAQGKFSLETDEQGKEMLINDLGGAHLLIGEKQKPISLAAFRAQFKQSFLAQLLSWLKVVM